MIADPVPWLLMETQGFLPGVKSKYERMDQDDGDRLYFFCNKIIDTKILIVYDPD
jgi:hypothetical protein